MTDHGWGAKDRLRRAVLACVVAALAGLGATATATAADVAISNSALTVTDPSGEANAIDVREVPGGYEIYDDQSRLTVSGVGCVAQGRHRVGCMVGATLSKVIVDLGDGNDVAVVGDVGIRVEVTGGDGDDLIEGGAVRDLLAGGRGEDTILGGAGGDEIDGQGGDDLLLGGTDGDIVSGGDGEDILEGGYGDGADILRGDAGRDLLKGGDGNDTLQGGDGSDALVTGKGVDTVSAGTGDDVVFATKGDEIRCGPGGAEVRIDGPLPIGCQALPATDTQPQAWPPPPGASGATTPVAGTQFVRAAFSGPIPSRKRFKAKVLSASAPNPKNLRVYVRAGRTTATARITTHPVKGKSFTFSAPIYIGTPYLIDITKSRARGKLKKASIVCCTKKR